MARNIYVKVGTAWKVIKQPYVKVGTAWKACKEVWAKVGTTWKQCWPPAPSFRHCAGTIVNKFSTVQDNLNMGTAAPDRYLLCCGSAYNGGNNHPPVDIRYRVTGTTAWTNLDNPAQGGHGTEIRQPHYVGAFYAYSNSIGGWIGAIPFPTGTHIDLRSMLLSGNNWNRSMAIPVCGVQQGVVYQKGLVRQKGQSNSLSIKVTAPSGTTLFAMLAAPSAAHATLSVPSGTTKVGDNNGGGQDMGLWELHNNTGTFTASTPSGTDWMLLVICGLK